MFMILAALRKYIANKKVAKLLYVLNLHGLKRKKESTVSNSHGVASERFWYVANA
jgi:hypothetical protein